MTESFDYFVELYRYTSCLLFLTKGKLIFSESYKILLFSMLNHFNVDAKNYTTFTYSLLFRSLGNFIYNYASHLLIYHPPQIILFEAMLQFFIKLLN